MTDKVLMWVAVILSIATYQLWPYLPKGYFYRGMAITLLIFAVVIYKQNSKLLISFFLLCVSISNLLDEFFFDPRKFGMNELIFAAIVPIIWYVKSKRNAGKIRKQ